MKVAFVFNLVFFVGYHAITQETGIRFHQGQFDQIKEIAAEQGKPIFIDIYTTWCGPCKKMDREVFSVDEVGDYFNDHFINYKVDAERGEGIGIARSYRVTAYPTMLFLDAEGQVQHTMRGYRPFEPFLDEAKTVIDTTHEALLAKRYMNDRTYRKLLEAERKQKMKFMQLLKKDRILDSLHGEYVDGNRDMDFLADYILHREELDVSDQKIVEEYFKLSKSDDAKGLKHLAVQAMKIEYAYDPDFQRIVEAASLGKEVVNNSPYLEHISGNLEKAFMASWDSAIENKDTTAVQSLIGKQRAYLDLSGLTEFEINRTLVHSKLNFYKSTGMSGPYHRLAQSEMQAMIPLRQQADSLGLMSYSTKISDLLLGYELLTIPSSTWNDLLNQAVENLQAYKHPHNYAPVLLMHHRLGHQNEAMNALREGMIMGKKQDLDTGILFKLFTRIKKDQVN